uniref:Retroviral polymerase SH3-like domain-containing protein n=1 Tax=Megaselia scalaris TaxID=36166 RepID=T1GX32_MEGSC
MVQVPDEKRKKLDNKAWTGIIIGCSEDSKGYRIFDPCTKKICISRNEGVFYYKSEDFLKHISINEDQNVVYFDSRSVVDLAILFYLMKELQ